MTAIPNCTEVEVNRLAIVAEVRAAFERYEAALVANDAATLNELFWDNPASLRFGIADRQRGAAEIHHWRQHHGKVPTGRQLHDTDVLTVGVCTAVVTTLFDYPNRPIEGRQTQVWVRFPRAGGSFQPTYQKYSQLSVPACAVRECQLTIRAD